MCTEKREVDMRWESMYGMHRQAFLLCLYRVVSSSLITARASEKGRVWRANLLYCMPCTLRLPSIAMIAFPIPNPLAWRERYPKHAYDSASPPANPLIFRLTTATTHRSLPLFFPIPASGSPTPMGQTRLCSTDYLAGRKGRAKQTRSHSSMVPCSLD